MGCFYDCGGQYLSGEVKARRRAWNTFPVEGSLTGVSLTRSPTGSAQSIHQRAVSTCNWMCTGTSSIPTKGKLNPRQRVKRTTPRGERKWESITLNMVGV